MKVDEPSVLRGGSPRQGLPAPFLGERAKPRDSQRSQWLFQTRDGNGRKTSPVNLSDEENNPNYLRDEAFLARDGSRVTRAPCTAWVHSFPPRGPQEGRPRGDIPRSAQRAAGRTSSLPRPSRLRRSPSPRDSPLRGQLTPASHACGIAVTVTRSSHKCSRCRSHSVSQAFPPCFFSRSTVHRQTHA